MNPPMILVNIARDAIRSHLNRNAFSPPTLEPPWQAPKGVFVTLWDANDGLRGCIGHMTPQLETLPAAVARAAVSAATVDPRFPAVKIDELPLLLVEVTLLEPPTPISDISELDPQRYGVVVRCGNRRGVLLPQVRGVETVESQVNIALEKAGIRKSESWTAERFEAHKIVENR